MQARLLAAAVLVTASLAAASPASAGPVSPQAGTMTVNTVGLAVSPVVSATGVFAGCTGVADLTANQRFTPGTAVFSGSKLVTCESGTLELAYTATIDKNLPGTQGSWQVVSGTGAYAGRQGGGRLTGNFNTCDPMGTGFCVLDTYTGVIT